MKKNLQFGYCLIIILLINIYFTFHAKASCQNINFSVTKTHTCIYDVLYFTASGMPSGSSYTWYIDKDTLIRTSSQTSYAFINDGFFSITLIITLPDQSQCTLTKNNFIKINPYPDVPDIQVSKKILCNVNEEVIISAIGSSSNIKVWDWALDPDSYLDAGTEIKHSFNSPGYKQISLRVKDDIGCSNTKKWDSVIIIYDAPDLDFIVETNGNCLPVFAEIKPQFDLKGMVYNNFNWTFPGANPSSGSGNTNHSLNYNTSGSFDIIIETDNSAGCKYSSIKSNIINAGEKIQNPDFTFDPVETRTCGSTGIVKFFNTTQNIDISKLYWEYNTGVRLNPIHFDTLRLRYSASGDLSVTMKYNDYSCVSSKNTILKVTTGSPVADFEFNPKCSCKPPLLVNFKDKSKEVSSIPILSYNWVFRDVETNTVLGTSNDRHPDFTFLDYGYFYAGLTVRDSTNCTNSIDNKTNPIVIRPPMAVFETRQEDTACVNIPVLFNVLKDSMCLDELKNIEWTFYDTNRVDVLGTSDEIRPSFTYTKGGSYHVGLSIEYYDFTCRADTIIYDAIYIIEDIIDTIMPIDTVKSCANTLIKFDFPAIDFLKENSKVNWKFTLRGQNEMNPIQYLDDTSFFASFGIPGAYDLTIYVVNEYGCKDSLVMENIVQISGLSIDFSATIEKGCAPLHTSLNAIINQNLVPGNVSQEINYNWKLRNITSGNILYADNNINPEIILNEKGVYDVTLLAVNAFNCKSDTTKLQFITSGIRADFITPPLTCERTTINLEENSIPEAVEVKWKVHTSDYTLKPADTSREITLNLHNHGIYDVTLYVISDMGCKDTITKSINAIEFSADFISNDTNGICSPAMIEFEAIPINANSFTWKFGGHQSFTTNDLDVAHVFDLFAMNTWTRYFDIELIYKNTALNCIDTIIKKDYILVYGSLPKMKVSQYSGCTPLTIEFTDQSINAVKTYMNFDDGSELDSLKQVYKHTYVINNPNIPFQTFSPFILAWDENNCRSIYRSPEDVIVYNLPEANFNLADTAGCEPFTVKMNNTSKLGHTYEWDFYNDGIINSTEKNPEFTFEKTGIYDIRLITTSQYGCRDTIVKTNFINTLPLPEPDFTLLTELICYEDTVFFIDQSTGKFPIVGWEWEFGDHAQANDRSSIQNPLWKYKNPGKYNVSLTVTDSFGCKKTATNDSLVIVRDTIPPPNKGIRYVTVENDEFIRVYWYENPIEIFSHYTLVKHDPDQSEAISFNFNRLDHTDFIDFEVDVQINNHCYELSITDQCDNESALSQNHCQVLLNTQFKDSNATLLNWTAYQGWDQVKEYRIYRSEPQNNYTYLATVPGHITHYVDSMLCNIEYCYYVTAVHPEKNYLSLSNTSCYEPPYRFDPTVPLVLRATVPDNKNVLTEFILSGYYYNTAAYNIYRTDARIKTPLFYDKTDVDQTFYMDEKVDVQQFSYEYYVSRSDVCKNTSGISNYGKSIVLNSIIREFDEVHLSWNAYDEWEKGVSHYLLERQVEGDSFIVLNDQIDPEFLNFIDADPELFEKHELCYRITAFELEGNSQISQSNIRCNYFPSRLYVPNAFSPNADDKNEIFKPVTISILYETKNPDEIYSFRIYSRWGELIFETNHPDEGWDGTFNGLLQAEDVYIYIIKASGKDNVKYELHGNVSLIR